MEQTQLMHEGHEVMGEEYCSGYMDSFGKWNTGFPCPPQEGGLPVLCCGTESVRYCCVRPKTPVSPPVSQMTLLLSITFAIAVTVLVIIIISCFHCACCFLYKKRQPATACSVYQMHCPSNASGVANMYSISGLTTPAETPRSVSRASSARSRLTNDSAELADLHHAGDSSRGFLPSLPNSRPGSIAYSDRTSSTVSDVTVGEMPSSIIGRNRFPPTRLPYCSFEPPPPYSAPNSTLVAVRTSSHGYNGSSINQNVGSLVGPISAPLYTETAISSDPHSAASQLRTFSQAPVATVLSGPSQDLGASARLSAMRLNHQLNSLASLRQGYANHISNAEGYYGGEYEASDNGCIPQPMNLISPVIFSPRESTSTAHIINTHNLRFDDNRLYTATKF